MLGDFLLDEPSAGIFFHKVFSGHIKIVGDKEGRFPPAVVGKDNLSDLAFVMSQLAIFLVNPDFLIFSFRALDVDSRPPVAVYFFDFFDQAFTSPPYGKKLDLFRFFFISYG